MSLSNRQPKYYRIVQQNSKQNSNKNSPEKLTLQIVRNKNYVYIDVNTQNGLCEMQSINPEDADQDAQKISNNTYICAINRLPEQSQKTLDYVYKLQQLKKIKQKFKKLIKQKLITRVNNQKEVSRQKLVFGHQRRKSLLNYKDLTQENQTQRGDAFNKNKKSNISIGQQKNVAKSTQRNNFVSPDKMNGNSVTIYRGIQTKNLKQYLEKKELQQLDKKILSRQKLLIAKYGFTNQYESITKQKSTIVRKHRRVILPQIHSSYHLNQLKDEISNVSQAQSKKK